VFVPGRCRGPFLPPQLVGRMRRRILSSLRFARLSMPAEGEEMGSHNVPARP